MKLLTFYITPELLEPVKQAIFEARGGAYGNFENCCWQTQGEGQYQEQGNSPVKNTEYKVEILCDNEHIDAAVSALKQAHPCDEPPYYILNV